jgi:uncharacterized OB-fold protein
MDEPKDAFDSQTEALFKGFCPSCGAVNYGPHTHCLLCKALLASFNSEAEGRTCPNCGREVAWEKQFCVECGTSLVKATTPTLQSCLQCGHILELGKKFCTNCGTPLGTIS